MSELKCCPFCGGKAFVDTHRFWDEKAKDFTVQTYGVKCYDCQTGTWQHYRKEEDAIKQWNTRTPMANVVEKLEEELLTSESAHAEAVIGMCGVSASGYSGEISAYKKAINIVEQEINNGLE